MSQDDLKHYGILRKSGRYPWGSGKDPYQRATLFSQAVSDLKKQGIDEKEIAKAMGLSVAQLRDTTTIAKEEIVAEQTARVVALKDRQWSDDAIAKELGISPGTVRLRLKNSTQLKESALRATANVIRDAVDKYKIVDVGKGVEHLMNISSTKLRAALAVLRDEGYETYTVPVRQVGSRGQNTNQLVLVPKGTGFGGARKMTDQIHTMGEWTEDGGLSYLNVRPPKSVSSKRMQVVYESADDGTIYVRPGVPDLDMGKNTYAQVRILVDGTHFVKGMAVLSNDLPDGVDFQVHSNKTSDVGKLGALKPVKRTPDGEVDMENPFGTTIKRQIMEPGNDEKVRSALNIVNEPGDWEEWRNSIPSQVLAKQPKSLIESQLAETRSQAAARLDEIKAITNPVVRQKALEDFAGTLDSDAVDLRAAAMPRQATKVIIPMSKMNKNEIYAPTFETGEKVVLIRYPHGGKFEIPEVVVNNNNRTAKKLLGQARDAIGIHPDVAERLSGADFDGDSVVVIPNRSGKIKGEQSLKPSEKNTYARELGDFNPRAKYGNYVETADGKGSFRLMKNTGLEMGMITNLITDMSIQGASADHIVRAVRHSMVVIDAEKHKLDYKQSEIDNGIAQLRKMYQSKDDPSKPAGGASTLLSRATAGVRLPDEKLRPAKEGGPIDPETGALVYVPTGKTRSKYDPKTQTYTDEKVPVTIEKKRLANTDDAFTLVRDKNDPVERLYAEHANAMKALANQVRLEAYNTKAPPRNPLAAQQYKAEVDKLSADLKAAEKTKPLFRRADVIAGQTVKMKRAEDPLLRTDPDRLAKVERQASAAARARLGLKKPVIDISDTQWDAIQSGAVSPSKLRSILEYADRKRVSELATPRKNTVVTTAISARARAMLATGAAPADVAAALGISPSTLREAMKRGDV